MSRRINVRGIIVKDGMLFAVRHKSTEGNEKHFWCTPGGGLEDGESLLDGVKREITEETGVTAQVGRLLFVQQFKKSEHESYDFNEFLEFFFAIENADDFEQIDLPTTTHGAAELAEFGWVDPQALDFLPLFIKDVDLAHLDDLPFPLIVDLLN